MSAITPLTIGNSVGPASMSLIEIELNNVRLASCQHPYKDLIYYADMWFNLRGDPKFALQISDEVKWQLLFATTAYRDATGVVHSSTSHYGLFFVQNLSINDLVLLYRILNSYQQLGPLEKKNLFFQHLYLIEKRLHELSVEPQNKQAIVQFLREQNDPKLHFLIQLMESTDQVLMEMKNELYGRYVGGIHNAPSYLIYSHIVVARRILESYITQAPSINLNGLGINELPRAIKHLTHITSINLSYNSNIFYNNLSKKDLSFLTNLNKITVFNISSDPDLIEMHENLYQWILQARGTIEFAHRIDASHRILKNYQNREVELELSNRRLTSLPSCFSKLTHLKIIHLLDNELTVIPDYIASFPRLKNLTISGFDISRREVLVEAIPLQMAERIRNQADINITMNLSCFRNFYGEIARTENDPVFSEIYEELLLWTQEGTSQIRAASICLNAYLGRRNGFFLDVFNGTSFPNIFHLSPYFNNLHIVYRVSNGILPIELANLSANCSLRVLDQRESALSPAVVDNLQQAILRNRGQQNGRGPRFFFNDHELVNSNRVVSIQQQNSITLVLAKYPVLLEAVRQSRQGLFEEYFTKLLKTKNFMESAKQEQLFVILDNMFKDAETNEIFRNNLVGLVLEAMGTCEDKILKYYGDIEIQWHLHCKMASATDIDVAKVLIGKRRMEILEDYSIVRSIQIGWANESIQIGLFYQLHLRDSLNLPISARTMFFQTLTECHLYPNRNNKEEQKKADLDAVALIVLQATSEKSDLVPILMESDSWRAKMEEANYEEFHQKLTEENEKLQESLRVFTEPLEVKKELQVGIREFQAHSNIPKFRLPSLAVSERMMKIRWQENSLHPQVLHIRNKLKELDGLINNPLSDPDIRQKAKDLQENYERFKNDLLRDFTRKWLSQNHSGLIPKENEFGYRDRVVPLMQAAG